MAMRVYWVVAIAGILLLAFGACGRDKPSEEVTPPAPSPTASVAVIAISTTAPATPQVQQPASTPTSTSTAEPAVIPTPADTPLPVSPTPFADLNDDTPSADDVSPQPVDELPTVEVVKVLSPSVVQIVTEILSMGFFNQPAPSQGVGTGVILDEQGHILTNNHVIAGGERITVTLSNGESYPAEIVGSDLSTDTAIIRIDAAGLQPAQLGNSSELQVGEDVIAIGHAQGLPGGPTVSKGVVSALGRLIETEQQITIVDLIQTDSSINPGNSGGPLVNNRAEVVGINTAIIEGGRGIGFAINIDDVKVVAAQLIDRGYVERGFLGISPVNLTPGLATRFGLSVSEGILVGRVIPGTAAAEANLEVEDIIVRLGDQPLTNTGELSKFLILHPPGETVDLVFVRGDEEITTQITLGERPN